MSTNNTKKRKKPSSPTQPKHFTFNEGNIKKAKIIPVGQTPQNRINAYIPFIKPIQSKTKKPKKPKKPNPNSSFCVIS